MSSAGPLHSYVNEQFSSNRCLYLPARRTGTSPWGGPETRHREGSPNLVDADTSGTAGGRGRTTSKGTAEVGVTPPRIGSWAPAEENRHQSTRRLGRRNGSTPGESPFFGSAALGCLLLG